jgi:hypothetical protein
MEGRNENDVHAQAFAVALFHDQLPFSEEFFWGRLPAEGMARDHPFANTPYGQHPLTL